MTQIAFILLTILMSVLVFAGALSVAGKVYSDKKKRRTIITALLVLLIGWLSYVTLLSLLGVFATTALPPRIPLLLILPCFAFMIWFFRSSQFNELIAATPLTWLIYVQSFRVIVELLLHTLYRNGFLPRATTYEGYNFEIIIGLSAVAIGYFGATKRMLSVPFILLWNIAGLLTLAIVVFLMISHAYFPGIYANPEPLAIKDFGSFPYTLLAGFLMPLAVFLHVFTIVKLKRV